MVKMVILVQYSYCNRLNLVSDFDPNVGGGSSSDLFKYHRTYFNDVAIKFPVIMPDYFENTNTKYLHFFQNHENKIHYLDLDQLSITNHNTTQNFQTLQLNINCNIPPFHKSITTSKGHIYLIGGSDSENTKKKLKTTYQFDFKNSTLLQKSNMMVSRSSFAICSMNNAIYAVGGLTNNSVFTNSCERYDIINDKWELIAPCNFDVLAPCITSFNSRYLFKFGGNSYDNKHDTFIEKYDSEANTWTPISFILDQGIGNAIQFFRVLTTNACIQINPQEIYIFGGYLEDNTGSNQTFLLHINDPSDDRSPSNYTITGIGIKTLTNAEAFWNNTPVIHDKQIFVLQNVPTPDQEDICLDDRRRVLLFNGIEWKSLN